jgi:hypothetical protein
MKSVGLRNPLVERPAVKKENPLLNRLKEYLEGDFERTTSENNYTWSENSLKGLENLLVADAHAAIIALQGDNNVRYAGMWLSAAYNRSSENLIVHDLKLPENKIPYALGYRLNEDRVLVNNGNAGNDMGLNASGVVINNGNVRDWIGDNTSGVVINNSNARFGMGWNAPGVVINNGDAGNLMGYAASGVVINNGDAGNLMGYAASGVVINNSDAGNWMGYDTSGTIICLKDPESYAVNIHKAKLVLKEQQCAQNPALSAYLTELRDLTLRLKTEYTNPDLVKEVLRRCNRSAIEKRITEILGKKGGSE